MFWITQDPSSRSDSPYLIEITDDDSHVLIVCVIGVWRHILDLWCVCVCVCVLCQAEYYGSSSSQPDAVHTHTTSPEYAAKHRSRT